MWITERHGSHISSPATSECTDASRRGSSRGSDAFQPAIPSRTASLDGFHGFEILTNDRTSSYVGLSTALGCPSDAPAGPPAWFAPSSSRTLFAFHFPASSPHRLCRCFWVDHVNAGWQGVEHTWNRPSLSISPPNQVISSGVAIRSSLPSH
jgi:hypothetical protein